MKIITRNSAFVQMNDLAYLNQSGLEIPASIFLKIFNSGIVIIDDRNRYHFIEFKEPKEIEFFKTIDWMIDYNKVKELSEKEIIELAQSIAEKRNDIAQKFNSMTQEQRKKDMNMVSQCELLDFKFYSLRDFLWFKQGHIKMTFPEGIELPTELSKEKGVKKLVRDILNRKKNKIFDIHNIFLSNLSKNYFQFESSFYIIPKSSSINQSGACGGNRTLTT